MSHGNSVEHCRLAKKKIISNELHDDESKMCGMCGIEYTSINKKISHLIGIEHAKNILRIEKGEKPITIVAKTSDNNEKLTIRKTKGDFDNLLHVHVTSKLDASDVTLSNKSITSDATLSNKTITSHTTTVGTTASETTTVGTTASDTTTVGTTASENTNTSCHLRLFKEINIMKNHFKTLQKV